MKDRIDYAHRLARRMVELGSRESPEGLGLSDFFTEHMEPAYDMIEDAMADYEAGDITKEELDTKAAGFLKHWREGARQWKAERSHRV